MKKLMTVAIAATLIVGMTGCKGLSSSKVKVTEREYIAPGTSRTFVPETAFGAYKLRVELTDDVVKSVVTNTADATAMSIAGGSAYLLLGVKQQ